MNANMFNEMNIDTNDNNRTIATSSNRIELLIISRHQFFEINNNDTIHTLCELHIQIAIIQLFGLKKFHYD